MELRNNNGEAVRQMKKILDRENRRTHLLMQTALAVCIAGLFFVFTLAAAVEPVRKLVNDRSGGSAANMQLSHSEAEQEVLTGHIMAGQESWFGTALRGQKKIFACVVCEEDTFEKVYSPAFTDITGAYPQNEREVMLSVSMLNELGITELETGMLIELPIQSGADTRTEIFELGGYYTDYTSFMQAELRKGFFAESFLQNIDEDAVEKSYLFISAEEENQISIPVVVAAGLSSMLILSSIFLLISSMLRVTFRMMLPRFGLLETLGMTPHQITSILKRQVLASFTAAAIAGSFTGIAAVWFLAPELLNRYYLYGYGRISANDVFQPELLLAAVLLAGVLLGTAYYIQWKKTAQLTPVEAVTFTGARKQQRKIRRTTGGSSLAYMAWRNLWNRKGETIGALSAISTGLIAVLVSVVFVTGTDLSHYYDRDPDFAFSTWDSDMVNDDYTDTTDLFPVTMVETFEAMKGIKSLEAGYGNYANVSTSESVWQPLVELGRYTDELISAGILIVDQKQITALEQFAAEQELAIDIDSLWDGTGAVNIIYNSLPSRFEAAAERAVGETFTVFRQNGETAGTLTFSGYINRNTKGFPEIRQGAHQNYVPYLIMSELAFERLGLYKTAFYMNIYTEPEWEEFLRPFMTAAVDERNQTSAMYQGYQLTIRAENRDREENRIMAARILTYGISFFLAAAGLINYIQTIRVQLAARVHELEVMEYVGMTRKQLRKMLAAEGVYFAGLTAAIQGTAGTAILILCGRFMEEQVGYAEFSFPYGAMGVLLAIIFIIAVMVPLRTYRKQK